MTSYAHSELDGLVHLGSQAKKSLPWISELMPMWWCIQRHDPPGRFPEAPRDFHISDSFARCELSPYSHRPENMFVQEMVAYKRYGSCAVIPKVFGFDWSTTEFDLCDSKTYKKGACTMNGAMVTQ